MSDPRTDPADPTDLLRAMLARHGKSALRVVARASGQALRAYAESPEAAEVRELAALVDSASGGTLSRLLRAGSTPRE